MRGKSIRKRPSPHSNLSVSHQSREKQGAASLRRPTFPPSSLTHPQEDPVTVAENQLVAALDELENIGALQRSNRKELEEILNPPGEADAWIRGSNGRGYIQRSHGSKKGGGSPR